MASILRRSSGPFPEPVISPFPGFNLFGGAGASTPRQAMQISAVWACVRLLAETVSMMPLESFRMVDGRRVPTRSVPQLLVKPAATGTVADWLYQIMVSLLIKGNAFGRIIATDGNKYPTQIEILDPQTVSVQQNRQTGQWEYKVNGVEVPYGEIWHVAAFLMPGSPVGLSPIQYAGRTIGTLAAAEGFGQSFFEDGAHPSAILAAPGQVNEANARTIKDRFLASVKGREPAVLGGGVTYTQVQISPEESQFLQTQKFGLTQIARIYGIPPEMIGGEAGNAMTYANVTQRAMDFLTYSVQGWLTRLEAAMFPLFPNQTHVRFDTSTLVRLDAQTQALVDTEHLNTASKSINEVRMDRNDPPVAWGDTPYLPAIKTPSAGMAIQYGDQPGSRVDAEAKAAALAVKNAPDPAPADPNADPNAQPADDTPPEKVPTKKGGAK